MSLVIMIIQPIVRLLVGTLLLALLSSCGSSGTDEPANEGGGSGSGNGQETGQLKFSFQGTDIPITNILYTVGNSSSSGNTTGTGQFEYLKGQKVTFKIGEKNYSVTGKSSVSALDLVNGDPGHANHLSLLLLNFDSDNNPSNGVQLRPEAAGVNPAESELTFMKQMYKVLGRMPRALFEPLLGINTEAVQGEADTVGQSMPFVDIFRTARPFQELSKTTYDENGWPKAGSARTKLLQGVQQGSIPDGKYTLLYEGTGNIGFGGGGIITSSSPLPVDLRSNGFKGNVLTFSAKRSDNAEANAINMSVNNIDETGPVRNISLIMPGGSCKNSSGKFNNFIRVESQNECPTGTSYVSFVERLKNNRNAIIFNPDYLLLLKDFKVIRMMNLMEASPGRVFCTVTRNNIAQIDEECIKEKTLWKDRATMNDAVWGGSSRTDHKEHKGVPVEVLVELANQTGTDPWFNIPHSADNHYVSKFSESVFNKLNSNRKAYIEYSNEIWNSGFLGFHYMSIKGLDAGLNQNIPVAFNGTNRDEEYFARLRFYAKRAVEIFDIWTSQFSGNSRLVRVLGTSQGDRILSENVLDIATGKVDALAMAPYFFGCVDRTGSCSDAPKVLSEARSVNDLFDIIDQTASIDPSALESTLNKIRIQANVANDRGVDLLAYEGGQHLTILGSMGKLPASEKQRLRNLFKAANRDPRMKERYTQLLFGWKTQEHLRAALFILYTLPQSFYEFGNWGIKEHLNKPRTESPKYDAAMRFQEQVGHCWWAGCR